MPDAGSFDLVASDHKFRGQRANDGNLVITTGSTASTGEIAAYTPASGKTFHAVYASLSANSTTAGPAFADVENNTTDKEYLVVAYQANQTTGKFYAYLFDDALVGDAAKKYRINVVTNPSSITVRGVLAGWIEDT